MSKSITPNNIEIEVYFEGISVPTQTVVINEHEIIVITEKFTVIIDQFTVITLKFPKRIRTSERWFKNENKICGAENGQIQFTWRTDC